ncbi:hypothetical protein JI721_15105 [Alicyclobacillus cycloheptanicus]|uniref:Uncharacterized protein n=1 Tax=Alicyclobacillus cycloheptanicus TaxID=1457 RepID=A0ABT9XEM3_9BACL|nr:hypothetical protein [Alicyclobacillus cycloheptanicus]MDQ0188268.1 hypothetical protein [Alicyclobacillus cycloheptanicus]WDM00986.1 hypothetical protein JI721_15105 [Alicyclobacillus cycloheptanicus]
MRYLTIKVGQIGVTFIARKVKPYEERLKEVEAILTTKLPEQWKGVNAKGKPMIGRNTELEKLSAYLLKDYMGRIADKNPDEYPVLSDRQMQSRAEREIPFDFTILAGIIEAKDGLNR